MLLKTARKIAVAVIGGTVLLGGVIMLVAPGPGVLGILAGLAILATEFAVAAKLLRNLKKKIAQAGERVGLTSRPQADAPATGTSGGSRSAKEPGSPHDIESPRPQ